MKDSGARGPSVGLLLPACLWESLGTVAHLGRLLKEYKGHEERVHSWAKHKVCGKHLIITLS